MLARCTPMVTRASQRRSDTSRGLQAHRHCAATFPRLSMGGKASVKCAPDACVRRNGDRGRRMNESSERLAQLSRAGKIGGRRRWITHPIPTEGVFDAAHAKFRQSFLLGHSCKACPKVTVIDQALPDDVKRTVAERLRREHYRNLALLSAAKRASE